MEDRSRHERQRSGTPSVRSWTAGRTAPARPICLCSNSIVSCLTCLLFNLFAIKISYILPSLQQASGFPLKCIFFIYRRKSKTGVIFMLHCNSCLAKDRPLPKFVINIINHYFSKFTNPPVLHRKYIIHVFIKELIGTVVFFDRNNCFARKSCQNL